MLHSHRHDQRVHNLNEHLTIEQLNMVTTKSTVQQSNNNYLSIRLNVLFVNAFIPPLKGWAFCCYDRNKTIPRVIIVDVI